MGEVVKMNNYHTMAIWEWDMICIHPMKCITYVKFMHIMGHVTNLC